MPTLVATFRKVLIDESYEPGGGQEFAKDYKLLIDVLDEVDFLYSRGILEEKKLGRLIDIVKRRAEC